MEAYLYCADGSFDPVQDPVPRHHSSEFSCLVDSEWLHGILSRFVMCFMELWG